MKRKITKLGHGELDNHRDRLQKLLILFIEGASQKSDEQVRCFLQSYLLYLLVYFQLEEMTLESIDSAYLAEHKAAHLFIARSFTAEFFNLQKGEDHDITRVARVLMTHFEVDDKNLIGAFRKASNRSTDYRFIGGSMILFFDHGYYEKIFSTTNHAHYKIYHDYHLTKLKTLYKTNYDAVVDLSHWGLIPRDLLGKIKESSKEFEGFGRRHLIYIGKDDRITKHFIRELEGDDPTIVYSLKEALALLEKMQVDFGYLQDFRYFGDIAYIETFMEEMLTAFTIEDDKA